MFSFISGSSFVFISVLHVPPKYFGLCFSFFVLGFMSGAYLGGRLTKSWKANKIILVGIILSLAAGVSLIVASFAGGSIIFLLLPLYPYMLGMGLITPLANASAIAPYPQSAGAAGGLMNFVSILFAAATGALLGHTPLTSAAPMAAFMTGSTILVALFYYAFIREKSPDRHSFAAK